jgi:hypothetical protein
MKSQCSEYQKRIARSLLGDLNPAEQKELEQHLAGCPQCRSEQADYAKTLDELKQAGDEPVPRHFFVHPIEERFSFWQVFRWMSRWQQAATLATAGLLLLFGIAALSHLQLQIDRSGLRLNFGGNAVDTAALKQEILMAADAAIIQEVRSEIARAGSDLSRNQRAELAAALVNLNARFSAQVSRSENNVRGDSQRMIAGVYQAVSQQRARDLEMMNLWFASAQADDALKTRQTDEILDTLLQEAELRLR